MTRLIKILAVLAMLWSLYWIASAYLLRQGIGDWFHARAADGWQAEFSDMSTRGFPLRHVTRLTGPVLADPQTGTAWRAEWIDLASPAIWPGHQTLRFAPAPQLVSYFDETIILSAEDMTADMRLRPGLDLQLETLALTSGPWSARRGETPGMAAGGLTLSMVQQTDPETYQVTVDAPDFMPGEDLRKLTGGTDALPSRFAALRLEMQVRFDRPWDIAAVEDQRPQPREIKLKLADAAWGALRLFATGDVTVDAAGLPTGALTIKAENWREMLAMVEAAGAIPAQALGPAERLLGMLAGLGTNPNALDVKLNLRDGFVALGPIPLGPAPRLILR